MGGVRFGRWILVAACLAFAPTPLACSSGESCAEDSEDGEESNLQLALTDSYDETRLGARLIVSYDEAANAFIGTVENTTNETLRQVRVEVHLSNGTELGPTPDVDLAPGESADVNLPATGEAFESWSAHPEVGSGEDGEDDCADGEEHGGEGEGEHG